MSYVDSMHLLFSSLAQRTHVQCIHSTPTSFQIFHKGCFTCSVCQQWLEPGEEAAVNSEGLYCRQHAPKGGTGEPEEIAAHVCRGLFWSSSITCQCLSLYMCVGGRAPCCVYSIMYNFASAVGVFVGGGCVLDHILFVTPYHNTQGDDTTAQAYTKNKDKVPVKGHAGKKPRQRTVLSEDQLALLKHYYYK